MCYKLPKSSEGQKEKKKKTNQKQNTFILSSWAKTNFFVWIYPWREDIHQDLSVFRPIAAKKLGS